MKKVVKETVLLAIVLIPLLLIVFLWSQIPETIPLHYGINGEADRFGSKQVLRWFVPSVLVLTYGILLAVPYIDPKKRITFDHTGFYSIRIITLLLISIVLSSYLFALAGSWDFMSSLPLLLMAFVIAFGNYMPTLKPNYFLGIRTPWTLENSEVWTRTHRFSGRLWMAGGVVGFLLIILWPSSVNSIGLVVILLLALTSIVYSYIQYKRITAQHN